MGSMEKRSATGRVITAYSSTYSSDYVSFQAGEPVRVEQRDSEWEGWVWCTGAAGQGGWVPEAYLEDRGETTVLTEDYLARELEVQPGDVLTLHRLVSEWFWAEDEHGNTGWVPAGHIDILPSR